MTTLQIKVAVMANALGSISAAAKELGLSQPNASNCIKCLENEIGFEIFNRAKNGTTLTDKGYAFLEHAKRMLDENESILNIKKHESIYRLRLGGTCYLSAVKPFIKLCETHRDDEETDFKYSNVSIKAGISELEKYSLDIIFAPALKSQLVGIKTMCKNSNMSVIKLGELPAVINIRKDHPAVLDGSCMKITQGCDLMKNYPYAAYNSLHEDNGSTGYNDSDFVQCSYKIFVDEIEVRRRIVASTNAFFFGLKPSNGINEQYGTVSFPIPGIMMEVFCIIRSSDRNRKEINEYLTLLREELALNGLFPDPTNES